MTEPEELFQNNQLDISRLPVADELQMIPLERVYKNVRYISAAIVAGIVMVIIWTVAASGFFERPYGFYIAGFISIVAIWFVIYSGLSFHHMTYAVRERDISFRSGVWWRNMTTVPFNRVQHCDLKQGLLDRKFGLSKLTIYTAGGQSTDLMIPGLLPETAERLKAFILESTERAREV